MAKNWEDTLADREAGKVEGFNGAETTKLATKPAELEGATAPAKKRAPRKRTAAKKAPAANKATAAKKA